MDNRIFDIYLKNNLIPSIGGIDEIYKSLLASAQKIGEQLKLNPSKILTYSLVAFDNQIQEGEPVLEEVEKSISDEWKMVRNHFSEMPIALYRAIILQALEHLIESDTEGSSAALVYLSVVDVYPYLSISEKEQNVLMLFLHKIGNVAEEKAVAEWAIDKEDIAIKTPTLSLKFNKVGAKVNEETLRERLIVASGPQGQDGVQRPNSNQTWPNNGSNWSFQFAPLAANGIAEIVNQAFNDQNVGIDKYSSQIQTELNKFFIELSKNFQIAFDESIQSSIAVEQRSQLLWWKETLYSQKLQKSYRKLPKFECAIAMAIDLYHILPDTFPVSVDYILREAFYGIHSFKDNEITFLEFLNQVNDSKNEAFLKQYFEEEKIAVGRMDLASFMTKVIYSKMDMEKDLLSLIGIAPDRTMSYEDISVWILHCFSVKHLTSN